MFDKILLAVDGSEPSNAAAEAAIALARKIDAPVEVVHVRVHDQIVSKAGSGPDLEMPEDATMLLGSTVDKLKSAGVVAHGTLRVGDTTAVARDIIEVADDGGADVLVGGRR